MVVRIGKVGKKKISHPLSSCGRLQQRQEEAETGKLIRIKKHYRMQAFELIKQHWMRLKSITWKTSEGGSPDLVKHLSEGYSYST